MIFKIDDLKLYIDDDFACEIDFYGDENDEINDETATIYIQRETIAKKFLSSKLEDFEFQMDITFMINKQQDWLTVCSFENKKFLVKDFFLNIFEWKEEIPFLDFLKNLEHNLRMESLLKDDIFFDERDSPIVTIPVWINDKNKNISQLIIELEIKFRDIIFKTINENRIVKGMSFTIEYLASGISILQYFGKLLQEKYPNEKVSVSIKQQDLKVTMTIETPDGKKEEIEEYLNRYGMVVTNQITPQEFASNPIQLIELKQELREAQNKILFQQELLSLKDDTYKNRIKSLEDEVNFLRKEFSTILLTNKENIEVLLNSLLTKDKLIKKLTKSIENRNNDETKQLLSELKEKDSKGYISLKQYIDNAIIGGIVNAPSWIQFTVGILSKVG